MAQGLRIAVVGLGFGSAFVPIYQLHPDVESVTICDPDATRLAEIGEHFGVVRRCARLKEVLESDCDAVHLLTPVPQHVEHILAVLNARKHCACAVPMATELDDLALMIDAEKRSGKHIMMMETAVYTREFFFVQDLLQRGALGRLTFGRGTYFQDLEGDYPLYWRAQPPMHYITHAIAPLLALARTRATRVMCLGSSRLRPDIQQPHGNPFPLQSALFQLEADDLAVEVTHSWFQTARAYTEAFCVYGDRAGFEWPQLEGEAPLLFTFEDVRADKRGRPITTQRVALPDRAELLPPSIQRFTQGGHGGSHPHLAHEWIRSIIEDRASAIDARTAANWCAPGLCAHQSALQNGAPIEIPAF